MGRSFLAFGGFQVAAFGVLLGVAFAYGIGQKFFGSLLSKFVFSLVGLSPAVGQYGYYLRLGQGFGVGCGRVRPNIPPSGVVHFFGIFGGVKELGASSSSRLAYLVNFRKFSFSLYCGLALWRYVWNPAWRAKVVR